MANLHNGLVLPAVPPARGVKPRQDVLALEHSAVLPTGYFLREQASGLQLHRVGVDGAEEPLGLVVSEEFACRHAAALERNRLLQVAQGLVQIVQEGRAA